LLGAQSDRSNRNGSATRLSSVCKGGSDQNSGIAEAYGGSQEVSCGIVESLQYNAMLHSMHARTRMVGYVGAWPKGWKP